MAGLPAARSGQVLQLGYARSGKAGWVHRSEHGGRRRKEAGLKSTIVTLALPSVSHGRHVPAGASSPRWRDCNRI